MLLTLALSARAQVPEDKPTVISRQPQLHEPDSLKSDYEEWLRNEPLRPEQHDTMAISPMPPSIPIDDPTKLKPKHPPVAINIMTPQLRTEMQLAHHSHWLEEQRKSQVGGAMTIGVNPLHLVGYLLSKLFPDRKSKKQREREKLQRILDNY
jgi:hypothetical protein